MSLDLGQVLGLALVFIAGMISGVTLSLVLDRPTAPPWWNED